MLEDEVEGRRDEPFLVLAGKEPFDPPPVERVAEERGGSADLGLHGAHLVHSRHEALADHVGRVEDRVAPAGEPLELPHSGGGGGKALVDIVEPKLERAHPPTPGGIAG